MPAHRSTRSSTRGPAPADSSPRAGTDRLPRLPIGALGLLTIVTYGACYYAYGVLIQPIGADMHWPAAALGAIFSAVLLITGAGGILAGGLLDRVGEQPLFLAAATVGACAMFVASFQTALLPFAVAYAFGCGLVGALGFYHVTQAVAARAAPAQPARAIIWLTLIGALAGPIYLPLTGWLVEALDWRAAIRVDAATVLVAFLFTAILVRGRGGPRRSSRRESAVRALGRAWRDPVMRAWLLATLISGAAVDALLVYQIPTMVKVGLPLGVAATVAGFRGLSQLAGRLPLGPLIARLGARRTIVLAYLIAGAAMPLLFASGTLALALAFSLLAGAATGALSALQGIYTHELSDPRHLGALLGTQQALFEVGGAAGPAVAGVLLGATGSFVPVVVVIVVGFALAAAVLTGGPKRRPT